MGKLKLQYQMRKIVLLMIILPSLFTQTFACSIFYYVDSKTGHIYFANNEDWWYNVRAYVKIIPAKGQKLARLWYGWKDIAQGGINEKGLVFDGAVTPQQPLPEGYKDPNTNIGDMILSYCSSVNEAIDYLEKNKIALTNSHIFFGDKTGNAAVIEWVNGKKIINSIKNNRLVATNFFLSDTIKGNYPCKRFSNIEDGLDKLENRSSDSLSLKEVGNVLAKAVQIPAKDSFGKIGGTLYSTFIDLTEMKLVLVYKLDNSRIKRFDILSEFKDLKERKIIL